MNNPNIDTMSIYEIKIDKTFKKYFVYSFNYKQAVDELNCWHFNPKPTLQSPVETLHLS